MNKKECNHSNNQIYVDALRIGRKEALGELLIWLKPFSQNVFAKDDLINKIKEMMERWKK